MKDLEYKERGFDFQILRNLESKIKSFSPAIFIDALINVKNQHES